MSDKVKTVKTAQSDDNDALQALLDKRGEVYIPDGRYNITRPLIIHDDTHLRLARGAYLRLADHANCSLIDNDGLYSRKTNRNIVIEGGIWDGNNSAQERESVDDAFVKCDYDKYITNSLLVLLMRIVHCENLTVRDLTFKDPTSYATHFADVKYFTIENIIFDFDLSKLNMDGIHIQGPARFGVIRNIMGDANDDHVALCANGTTRSEVTSGIIEDIDIDGIYCENGYTGVRLLSCGDAVRNIRIRNIHGRFRFYAVSFTHHYPLRPAGETHIDNVHISDVYTGKSDADFPEQINPWGALIWFESGMSCDNITLENIFRTETNEKAFAPTIRVCENAKLSRLTIKNVRDLSPSPRRYETLENLGEVNELEFMP